MALEIRLFGEPSFLYDGAPWQFTAPPRALPLLVYLAIHAGTPVSRAKLAGLLWPDDDDETARANLRRHLHQVLRALPPASVPWIVTKGANVWWNTDASATIDAVQFAADAADETAHERAVALYRGDLAESLYDEWLVGERERLRTMQLAMLYGLGVRARAERAFDAANEYADRMLRLDEWREDALRLGMSARYDSGDRSAALAMYDRFALRLREHLDVAPMPETIALRERIAANSALPTDDTTEQHAPFEHARRHRLPFVGRAEEVEELRAAWTRAARGNGNVVFIAGEAGAGKSRLASALAMFAEAEGGRVLWGTTADPESAPFQPFAEAARAALPFVQRERAADVWLASLAQLLPEVRAAFPDLAEAPPIEPDAQRKRLLEALAQVIARLARVRPVLLVLEDVHWAGEGTLLALDTLARRVARLPVLMLATYRSDEASLLAPLRALRASLQRERYASQLSLGRLTQDDVTELVAKAALTHESLDREQTAQFVYGLSEGNALFAAQLIEEIQETGVMPAANDAQRTLPAAIAARIGRLNDNVRDVAQAASVLGRSFPVDVLAALGGWSENTVLDAMGELIDRSIVSEEAGRRFGYAFTHALIQNAMYESIEPSVRAARHRRAAQVLEREPQTLGAGPGALALHWDRAGDASRARAAYQQAAQTALAMFSRDQAVAFARRALELAEDDAQRYAALAVAATAQMHYGDVGQWRTDVEALGAVALQLGDDERYRALEILERLQWQTGERDAQRETIERMTALAQRSRRSDWRVTALYALGNLEADTGRLVQAQTPLQEALAIAQAAGDASSVRLVRQRLIQLWVRTNDLERAREAMELQRADLESGGSDMDRLYLVRAQAIFGVLAEDGEITQRTGEEMLALARRIGDVESEGKAYALLAIAAHLALDVEAGMRSYEAAVQIFERLGQTQALASALTNYGGMLVDCGRIADATPLLERAIACAATTGAATTLANAYLVLAESQVESGKIDDALANAGIAHDTAAATHEQKLIAGTLVCRGRARLAAGDTGGLDDVRAGFELRAQTLATRQILADRAMLVQALLQCGYAEEAREHVRELARAYAAGECDKRSAARVKAAIDAGNLPNPLLGVNG